MSLAAASAAGEDAENSTEQMKSSETREDGLNELRTNISQQQDASNDSIDGVPLVIWDSKNFESMRNLAKPFKIID